MKIRDAALKLKIYQAGKPIEEVKRELGLEDIIKLASNENPLGCSPKVQEVIKDLCDKIYLYPDASNYELKKAIAQNLGVKIENVFCSTGSDSLIRAICSLFVGDGDETIMGEVSFQRYEDSTVLMGGKAVKIPMINNALDVKGMVNAINKRTRVLWFCTPNNPTGTIITKDELLSVLDLIPEDVIIVMDEAYYEYVTDENFPQTIPLLEKYKNMIILRTFSKAYGLAGLRCGYGVANEEIARYINTVVGPFDTNLVAQKAAVAALGDTEFLNKVIDENTKGREYLYREYERLGLEYIKSHANFIMVNTNRDDKVIFNELLKRGIIIRPGYLFGMEGWLRVSIGTMQQNERYIKELENILNK
ncbi:histidinol-phosphate aminotransferase [Caloramator quimbayensis]|uniref:Histidinol-phosphate aminotransferase n=1 Tax=Caloramator quimbayensis TaxID=1147123 RepID=A0A1T4Y9T9_9CLOT|nr:histidinol-phosphate transaminase [Caloramator quimbayensis]SKA98463.1 histidinol-phosphate aminotransferase [Caloramator quimbayensis]